VQVQENEEEKDKEEEQDSVSCPGVTLSYAREWLPAIGNQVKNPIL
jgi:hypothetical protein